MSTAPQLAPLTPSDREQLSRALRASDDETCRFLGPLLGLEPVQHLLMSFVHDTSRSFEDHVWDPVSRDVLSRLRDAGVSPGDSPLQVNNVFETALRQQAHGGVVALETDDEAALMAEVDRAQTDGKAKFKRGDYYAALNAFKESIKALLKYHEDQYYGTVIDPQEWDENELRERYVTLCCNVAICAIKLGDYAMIRLYASKALRVDETCSKAIHALGKVNLLEHRFDDARSEAKKGQRMFPDKHEFRKLLKEIETAEHKQLTDRAELLAIKELAQLAEEDARKRREQEEAEKRAMLERTAEVTRLPELDAGETAFQRLNTYFMRIKQAMEVTIDPLYNPDNGEPPLFECNLINRSTGVALATGIRAGSKKAAKQAAARAAIQTLWKMKRDAGKLLPEDQEHWEEYEKAQRNGTALPPEPTAKRADDENAVVAHQTQSGNKVVQLTIYERQTDPAPLLHQLGMQGRLVVDFTVKDVTTSKIEPSFECTCVINGETLGVATARTKKKAKADAAKLALDAAVARGIIQYVRTFTVVEDPHAGGAEPSTGSMAAEVA